MMDADTFGAWVSEGVMLMSLESLAARDDASEKPGHRSAIRRLPVRSEHIGPHQVADASSVSQKLDLVSGRIEAIEIEFVQKIEATSELLTAAIARIRELELERSNSEIQLNAMRVELRREQELRGRAQQENSELSAQLDTAKRSLDDATQRAAACEAALDKLYTKANGAFERVRAAGRIA